MSENKEFRIPFDESRRGRADETSTKGAIRRGLGRAIDRPTIGRRHRGRNNHIDIDMPTGGRPGKRRPTGTVRDIDGDGWVDEGTTNPRWIGTQGPGREKIPASTENLSSGAKLRDAFNDPINVVEAAARAYGSTTDSMSGKIAAQRIIDEIQKLNGENLSISQKHTIQNIVPGLIAEIKGKTLLDIELNDAFLDTGRELLDSISINISTDGIPFVSADPIPQLSEQIPDKRNWRSIEIPKSDDVSRILESSLRDTLTFDGSTWIDADGNIVARKAFKNDSTFLEYENEEARQRFPLLEVVAPKGYIINSDSIGLMSLNQGTLPGTYGEAWEKHRVFMRELARRAGEAMGDESLFLPGTRRNHDTSTFLKGYIGGLIDPSRFNMGIDGKAEQYHHDLFGHLGTGRGFDRHGEWANDIAMMSIVDHPDSPLNEKEKLAVKHLLYMMYSANRMFIVGRLDEEQKNKERNIDSARGTFNITPIDSNPTSLKTRVYAGNFNKVIEQLVSASEIKGLSSGKKIYDADEKNIELAIANDVLGVLNIKNKKTNIDDVYLSSGMDQVSKLERYDYMQLAAAKKVKSQKNEKEYWITVTKDGDAFAYRDEDFIKTRDELVKLFNDLGQNPITEKPAPITSEDVDTRDVLLTMFDKTKPVSSMTTGRVNSENLEVLEIGTKPSHQRQGLAAELFNTHRETFPELDLQHSDVLSDDGRAFAEATPASPQNIEDSYLSSGKLRQRPEVELVEKNLKDGDLNETPEIGVIGMRYGGFSQAKEPSNFDEFIRQEYREWSIGSEKVIFGLPELPEQFKDDKGYYDGSAKIVPINPYVISGLSTDSPEGREIARKWAYAKTNPESNSETNPTYLEALLYAGVRGDSSAMDKFEQLAEDGEKAIKQLKEKRKNRYIEEFNSPDTQAELRRAQLDNLSIDDLYVVHETKYKPEFDEDGNLLLRPMGDWILKNTEGKDATYNRETIHFGLNHLAGGHMMRQRINDTEERYIVIAKLSDIIEQNNGSVDALNPVDVGLVPAPGKPLRIPKESMRIIENSNQENIDEVVKNTLKDMGAKHIFTPGEMGDPTETKALLKIAADLDTTTNLHSNTPSGYIEQLDTGTNKTSSFIGRNWLSEMSDNAVERIANNDRWNGLAENGFTMSRREYEEVLKRNNGSLTSMTDDEEDDYFDSNSLSSGRAPRYPREPTYGPLIGGAEEEFGNASTWEEFAKMYRGRDIIWLDYETTGLVFDEFGKPSSRGKPVQIGAVKVRDGKVVDRFNIFINPEEPLGEWSRDNLKGPNGEPLTDDWLSQQVSLREAHQLFAEFSGEDAMLGVQNAAFDKNVLEDELSAQGIEWRPSGYVDTRDVSGMTLPVWTPETEDGPHIVKPDGTKQPSSSLKPVTEYLGVELGEKHHTADADAEAAALVMEAIIDGAIKNNWSTDILDKRKREEHVSKQNDRFEKDIARFEKEKAEFINASSGGFSSGKVNKKKGNTVKYLSDNPSSGKKVSKQDSEWLKGLDSKQIANLLVPASENEYKKMLMDGAIKDFDNQPKSVKDAVMKYVDDIFEKNKWAQGDFSTENRKAMTELLEKTLDDNPALLWAFQNFGAPSFLMWSNDGEKIYEERPGLMARLEQIRQDRGLTQRPYVRAVAMANMDAVFFSRKAVIDKQSNEKGIEQINVDINPNHLIKNDDSNIDSSLAATIMHEYAHWLHMRILRDDEGNRNLGVGLMRDGSLIPSTDFDSMLSVAKEYNSDAMNKAMLDSFKNNLPIDAINNIPRTTTSYAHSNAQEMLAEGFVAVMHPNREIQNKNINKKLKKDVYKLLGLEEDIQPWGSETSGGESSLSSGRRTSRAIRKKLTPKSKPSNEQSTKTIQQIVSESVPQNLEDVKAILNNNPYTAKRKNKQFLKLLDDIEIDWDKQQKLEDSLLQALQDSPTLTELAREFGLPPMFVTRFGVANDTIRGGIRGTNWGSTKAAYAPGNGVIVFNPETLDSKDIYVGLDRRTPSYTIRHEIGHAIDAMSNNNKDVVKRKVEDINTYIQRRKDFIAAGGDIFKHDIATMLSVGMGVLTDGPHELSQEEIISAKQISNYASTNRSEYIAEAIAHMTAPNSEGLVQLKTEHLEMLSEFLGISVDRLMQMYGKINNQF